MSLWWWKLFVTLSGTTYIHWWCLNKYAFAAYQKHIKYPKRSSDNSEVNMKTKDTQTFITRLLPGVLPDGDICQLCTVSTEKYTQRVIHLSQMAEYWHIHVFHHAIPPNMRTHSQENNHLNQEIKPVLCLSEIHHSFCCWGGGGWISPIQQGQQMGYFFSQESDIYLIMQTIQKGGVPSPSCVWANTCLMDI